MKGVVFQILGFIFLGIGVYKGWEKEVYLLCGIFLSMWISMILTTNYISEVIKKIDELIIETKKDKF
jgi:hypothetical protein